MKAVENIFKTYDWFRSKSQEFERSSQIPGQE